MKRILCYGDSNTWGQKALIWEKYPNDLIWTSLLQNKLGQEYQILVEGLCGRTAGDIDFEKPFHNGLEHFLSHAYSAYPFEAIIIALGTNDLQKRFARSANDIYHDLMSYIDKLKFMRDDDGIDNIKFFFMLPPKITLEIDSDQTFEHANSKSAELLKLLNENIADRRYSVIDITDISVTSEDGLHFSVYEHKLIAERAYQSIKTCLT